MAKAKTVFYCTNCGNETPRWQGKCPACGAWNTIEEHIEKPVTVGRAKSAPVGQSRKPQRISEVTSGGELRFSTGMGELDRVLGGGAVAGSLVLVGGAPGIGKSTLLLQICTSLCVGRKVLYISGEESERQLKLRADRLGVVPDSLYILSETRLSGIMEAVSQLEPDILIVDSIQTLYNEENESAPGSISQVKDCTMTLMQLSKSQGITVFVVGHINKDGNIAGPKVLEHMVDCVLYFEGDPNSTYRLLRAAKNRFGSTNEIGVFEMQDAGLVEVPNPSQMLLEGRPEGASGTCVACVMEGTRPVLAEVQALVTKTTFNVPRRAADGFDFNRAVLLLAVMEKRAGMKLNLFDAYLNVIGGLRLDEPGADLPVILAVASSYRDQPIADDLVVIGEVGMTGEIRSVSHLNQRLGEASRLGFKKCMIPRSSSEKLEIPDGMTVYRVRNVREAIEAAM
ncbi:MAG: DNA repair protein RadA [Oscillospiraceae bacterium]|nr:DNA repair protein RadA [Oscillospiraceae bacterium]MDY5641447.1 DNA repair protein RadA [Candidatus Faecousia sp.]